MTYYLPAISPLILLDMDLTNEIRNLHDQINTLEARVADNDQTLIENYAEFTVKFSEVGNRIINLDSVVLEHHPESHSDLGYQLYEETSTPTEEEVADSTLTTAEQ